VRILAQGYPRCCVRPTLEGGLDKNSRRLKNCTLLLPCRTKSALHIIFSSCRPLDLKFWLWSDIPWSSQFSSLSLVETLFVMASHLYCKAGLNHYQCNRIYSKTISLRNFEIRPNIEFLMFLYKKSKNKWAAKHELTIYSKTIQKSLALDSKAAKTLSI
jgi:hypothetical protein